MILFVYNLSLLLIDVAQLLWRTSFLLLQSVFKLVLKTPNKSVAGQNVLITGGGHGLGRELALEFARRGAKVVLWDINQEGGEQTVAEVKKLGGKAAFYSCDVSDRDAVQRTAQRVVEEFGNINILVNNAGIMPVQPFNHLNPQQVRRVIEVNTMGPLWTTYEFLPRMMDVGRGHVVSISSMAGRYGIPNLLPYSTSKFAVAGMMESLREEFRYYKHYMDINFTTVFPMFISTGFYKNPRIKYPWVSPIMTPEHAATKIIEGVQRNASHVYLPRSMEFFYRIWHIFPESVQNLIVDFVDAGLNPQED